MVKYLKTMIVTWLTEERITYILLLFIFFLFAFGRAFAVLHLGPIYITEVILFIALLALRKGSRVIFMIPSVFLRPYALFLSYAFLHLIIALVKKNSLALRDAAIFYYMLFLPLVFILFSRKEKLKFFLLTILAADCAGLFFGRLLLHLTFKLPTWLEFITQAKACNYLLYYGIALSYLLSLFCLLKKLRDKLIFTLLAALNIYMQISWMVRASWVACGVLLLFLMPLLDFKKIMRCVFYLVPVFLILAFFFLRQFDSPSKEAILKAKLPGLYMMLDAIFSKNIESLYPEQRPLNTANQASVSGVNRSPAKQSIGYKLNYVFNYIHDINARRDTIESFTDLKWRWDMWYLAVTRGMESPIFGKGLGVWPVMRPYPKGISANSGIKPVHNHLLSVFFKTGIVGLGLFLFLNLFALLYGLSYLKACKSEFIKYFLIGTLGAFVYWHTMASFYDTIDSPPTSIFLWILMGLVFACVEADKKIGANAPN